MEVRIDTSALDAVPERLRRIIFAQSAAVIKSHVRNEAKSLAHVRTGNMRNLITDGDTVVDGDRIVMRVVSRAEYARYEEKRGASERYPQGHAYMAPAVLGSAAFAGDVIRDAVEEAVR